MFITPRKLTKLIAIDFALSLQHKAMHLIMHEIAFAINVTHSFELCGGKFEY